MNIIEVFRQAVDSIRANKLRSSLTLLAIAVGVFAVIGSNTAVLVLDTYFKETLTIMGGNVITVQKRPGIRMGGGNWQEFRNRKDITFAQMEQLSERGQDIENVGPQENFQVTKVQFAENTTEPNVAVRGGNEYFVLHNAYNIEMGRNFTPEDVQNGRNMVIIGHDIFRDLFDGVDPINKEIRVDGRPYQVIGVTESKGAIFGNSQDRFVVAPYTTMLNVYGGTRRDIAIQVSAKSIDNIDDAIDEITGLMRLIRKVEPGDANDFEIVTNESLGSAFDQFTGVLYIIGFVVGGISLLGAGIGVMNIMLVSVTERTREIGTRKALGANQQIIVLQFLAEAILVSVIGGFMGTIMGLAVGNGMAVIMSSPAVFPVQWMILALVVSVLVGILSGWYPARQAAKLDPIEALRYE